MNITIDKSRVTTPTEQADNARTVITVEDETATVEVVDRRSGAILLKGEGLFVEIDRTAWRVGDWLVERQQGCGCGPTTIRPV